MANSLHENNSGPINTGQIEFDEQAFNTRQHALMDERGVKTYEKMKVTPGLILFNSTVRDNLVVINQIGEIVIQIKSPLEDGSIIYRPIKLGADSNFLCILKDKDDPKGEKDPKRRSIASIDKNGNILWRTKSHWLTHDFQLVNNNIYAITRENIQISPQVNMPLFSNNKIIRMDLKGNTIWEWSLFQNLSQFKKGATYQKIIDKGQSDPFHLNSIQYVDSPFIQNLFNEPVIVVSARNLNKVFFVGIKTSKVVFEFDECLGQHDAQIIQEGLRGENNLLLLDNGVYHLNNSELTRSRVIEVDIKTRNIVWEYGGLENQYYISTHIAGSVQRIPDGNTLICEGNRGIIFETDSEDKLVWYYIYPDFYDSNNFISDNTDLEHIYKAYKFFE